MTDLETKFQNSGRDLQKPGKNGCSEQILQAVVLHERDHQNGGRCRRG